MKLIIIAIAGIAILGMGAVAAVSSSARPAQQSSMYGGLGSAHEHAEFIMKINGTDIDFGESRYQVRSLYVHVEGGIGTTLHKHATSAPIGEFLRSVNIGVSDACILMDDGEQYCRTDEKMLRFFVNGKERPSLSIQSYVLHENDRFLLIYGNETEEQIQKEIERLGKIVPFRAS